MHPTVAAADEDDESSASTEDEIVDDLEFSSGSIVSPLTSLCISCNNRFVTQQVSVISSAAGFSPNPATSSMLRPGVRSLPPNVQRSFSDHFTPCIIAEMGCSALPWLKLNADTIQGHVNTVYSGHDYAVERGDGFHASVCPRTH